MIVDLPDTDTGTINKKIVALREEGGAITLGRVLTLVIAPDTEALLEDSIEAANAASREHPCRVIVVIPGDRLASEARLDAQLRVGRDAGSNEVVVLRLSGPLAGHASSVVMPFLLPDTPVVTWWPDIAPAVPAQDPLGQLAVRRITDATNVEDPLATIKSRLQGYTPGDTDLAWSRVTYWRALLTAAVDQAPYEPITSALVSGLKEEPALDVPGRLAGQPDRRSGDARRGRTQGRTDQTQRNHHVEPPADGRHREADPYRPTGSISSAGPQGGPRLPGRGHAQARRRRDLPGGPAGHRQGEICLSE